jgi:hypothetical protein
MAISLLTPAVLAGAIAASIVMAPMAGADLGDSATGSAEVPVSTELGPKATKPSTRSAPNTATTDYSSSQIPQGWRNDALWARPGTPGSTPFGSGARPPVVALD